MLKYILSNNETANYVLFLLILSSSIVLGKVVYYFFKNPLKRFLHAKKREFNEALSDIIEEPLAGLMVIGGFYFGKNFLILSEKLEHILNNILFVSVIFVGVYSIIRLVDLLILKYLTPAVKKTKSKLDDQLVPIIRRVLKIIIVILTLMMILDNFGIDITSLLAGLGIGGLAMALAAKDTLANIFGSIAIFTDKPFQVDDVIKIDRGDKEGIVKAVGLRSTRIKTWDGTEIVIPNSKIAISTIENISKRKGIKRNSIIRLKYENDYKKIEKAVVLIKKILQKVDGIDKDFYVGFRDYDDWGLLVQIVYWVKYTDSYQDYLDVRTVINLNIKKVLDKEKIEVKMR